MADGSTTDLPSISSLQRGDYADPPYRNLVAILTEMQGAPGERPLDGSLAAVTAPSGLLAETHWIVRRSPFTVVAGLHRALEILDKGAGYIDSDGKFHKASSRLRISAVEEGDLVAHDGRPDTALPILTIRGRFADYALLKTPMLGVLARASRIATNTYTLLQSSGGKPVYTFSARYDPPETQSLDGYAYHVGVRRYNRDYGTDVPDDVSTAMNARWWNGGLAGTISHEAIACFLGDASELMARFCQIMPVESPRIALVDFHNDCIGDTRGVMTHLFRRHRELVELGEDVAAASFRLDGVRVDTSRELVDVGLASPIDDDDYGPSPRLISELRESIDATWRQWDLPDSWLDTAREWCRSVKIIVSGGFTEARIRRYEAIGAPVDAYGVGSALLDNCASHGTVNDFSSVVMRVRVGTSWIQTPKVGRKINANPGLRVIRAGTRDVR